jgi:hypothetical protein
VIFIDPSPSSVALKEGVDEDSSLGFVSVVNVRFPSPLLSEEEEDIVVFVTVEDEEEEDENEESDKESLNGHGSSKGSQTEITPLK